MNNNITRKTIPLSELNKEDTVEVNGVIETVNMNNLNVREGSYNNTRFPKGITVIGWDVPVNRGIRHEGA